MPNLNLTHSGNMNITSASIGAGGVLNVSYEPNNTGYVTGWTVTPELTEVVCGQTYDLTFYPQFSGTVLTETFTVSGVDESGVRRSDSATLRQEYDTNLMHYTYIYAANDRIIGDGIFSSGKCEASITIIGDVYHRNAAITLSSVYEQGVSYVWEVPVVEPGPGPDTGSTISDIDIIVADSITGSGVASASYSPSGAYVNLVYSSTDTSKATIDPSTGAITVLEDGIVTICVTDTISSLGACKQINVYKEAPGPDTGTAIDFLAISVPAYIWDECTGCVTAQYSPSSAAVDLHYTSNLPSVAEIDEYTGDVIVHQTGNITFCVSDTRSGLSDCMSVNVGISDTGDTGTSATAITINVPNTITDRGLATTTVEPEGADVNLYYTYEDTEIIGANTASIDRFDGTIIVRYTGTARFCVEDRYTGLKDCKVVNVVKTPEPSTNITALTLNVDSEIVGTGLAYVEYEPSGATVNIVYTSSDTSKATIDNEGNITVLQDGTVTICATDTLTNISDCKTVTVVVPDSNCRVGIRRLDYITDGTKLYAGMTCDYAPDPIPTWEYTYRSNDTSIATPIVFESDTNDIVSVNNEGYVTICVDEGVTDTSDCMRTMAVKQGAAPVGLLSVTYRINNTNIPYVIAYTGISENNIDIGNAYRNGGVIPKSRWGEYTFYNTGSTVINYSLLRDILTTRNFQYIKQIRAVTVPDGVRGIINGEFTGCNFLQSVTLPSSCTIIGDSAFADCWHLHSISLQNVQYIGSSAFRGKIGLIPSAELNPDGQPGFDDGTKLYSVSLYNCRKIGETAFADNQNLTYVYFGSNNVLTEIGKNAFQQTGIRSITFPDSLLRLDDYVFHSCPYLKTAVFGPNIQYIGKNVFYGCSMDSVTIKATVPPFIEDDAFGNGSYPIYVPCAYLNDYKTAYPRYAYRFQCKQITELTIVAPNTITNSGYVSYRKEPEDADNYNITYYVDAPDLATVDSTGYVTVLAPGACGIYVRDTVSGLEDSKFVNLEGNISALTLNVPNIVNTNDYASVSYSPSSYLVNIVYTTSDASVATIDETTGKITVIDDGTVIICARDTNSNLSACKTVTARKSPLQVVEIDYNITTTGDTFIFYRLSYSTDYPMGNVTRAYYKDGNDNEVEMTLSPDNYGHCYYQFPETGVVTVYYELKEQSKSLGLSLTNQSGVKAPVVALRLPVGVEAVPGGLSGSTIQRVSGPDVKNLWGDFANCSNLIEANFPGLETIATHTFSGCTHLSSFVIPNTVTEIGLYAFAKTGLSSVNIPSSVTSIGNYVFASCSTLNTAEVHCPIVSKGLFRSCQNLTSVVLGAEVTRIENFAFNIKSALTSIKSYATTAPYIPYTKETSISQSYAFYGFYGVKHNGVFEYPANSTGYDTDGWGGASPHSLQYLGWSGSPTL